MFGTYLLGIAGLMTTYLFWRMGGVPILGALSGLARLGLGFLSWTLILSARMVSRATYEPWAMNLETVGLSLLIVIALAALLMALVDLVTGFGLFMPGLAPSLRGAACVAALALSAVALIQGLRAPEVTEYEVALPGLPKALDGMTMVAMSDLHVGTQLGPEWLGERVDQALALRPDMIVLVGDIIEGHSLRLNELQPVLRRLHAPLGVYAVAGNHETHGSLKKSLDTLSGAGLTVLFNRWVTPAPGLVLAGVEDLSTHDSKGVPTDPIALALTDRPAGATILLSHTPQHYEEAAGRGVGLMLSGHTHGGQVWPFSYVVRWRYPLFEGRYKVGDMTVIVSRGAGMWGPRMRLWKPGEILKITLRSK